MLNPSEMFRAYSDVGCVQCGAENEIVQSVIAARTKSIDALSFMCRQNEIFQTFFCHFSLCIP